MVRSMVRHQVWVSNRQGVYIHTQEECVNEWMQSVRSLNYTGLCVKYIHQRMYI